MNNVVDLTDVCFLKRFKTLSEYYSFDVLKKDERVADLLLKAGLENEKRFYLEYTTDFTDDKYHILLKIKNGEDEDIFARYKPITLKINRSKDLAKEVNTILSTVFCTTDTVFTKSSLPVIAKLLGLRQVPSSKGKLEDNIPLPQYDNGFITHFSREEDCEVLSVSSLITPVNKALGLGKPILLGLEDSSASFFGCKPALLKFKFKDIKGIKPSYNSNIESSSILTN